MAVALASGVTACFVGTRVILLDLRTDTYLCASTAVAAGLQLGNPGSPVLAPLHARGLLAEDGLPANARPRVAQPDSHFEPSAIRPSRSLVLRASTARLTARLQLRLLGIQRVIRGLERRKHVAGMASTDERGALAIAAAFAASDFILPSRNRCLPSSVALASTLLRAGYTPSVVIGVKLHPFEAHCWVQIGGLVLNDTLDHVLDFEPILTV